MDRHRVAQANFGTIAWYKIGGDNVTEQCATWLDRDIWFVGWVDGRNDHNDVDHKCQRIARLDDAARVGVVAIGLVGGNVQLQLLTGLDADQALVPAVDDACLANVFYRIGAAPVVAAVELGAIDTADAHVVHHDLVASLGWLAGTGS